MIYGAPLRAPFYNNMDKPKRKPIRLSEYDYSSAGVYFVTICTHEKRRILSDVTVGALHEAPAAGVQLTAAGNVVLQVLQSLPHRFPELQIDHYVIMPNHVHLLLRITEERALREAPLQDKRSLLSKAVGFLKMNSNKQIHMIYPDLTVWQRSYYEHMIRNEQDDLEIWKYIEGNPGKWAEDMYYF